jgi:mRNA-degrading endonuclease RelE of RelBE toxin-antitoxin system
MARSIQFANRFQRTWKGLSEAQRERVLDIILELPDLMKNPHRHSGFGLRRLQGSAYYEARIDLRWRLIMKMDTREIVLFDVLNHDQVRSLIR